MDGWMEREESWQGERERERQTDRERLGRRKRVEITEWGKRKKRG